MRKYKGELERVLTLQKLTDATMSHDMIYNSTTSSVGGFPLVAAETTD